MQADAFLLYIVTNAFVVGPNMTAPESDTPGGSQFLDREFAA
jgi:hypothetical protein